MSKKGSVLGGTLLVAGCSIGAGMLGLPVLTAFAGFKPSIFMCVLTWAYMCCTGLLLLEVNLWYKDEISIVSMAERTLGFFGKITGWVVFVFLFYSLMVAYTVGCGELFSDFALELAGVELAPWVGSLFFIALFGLLIYLGTFVVDEFNRILMLGLVITYALLVVLGLPHVDLKLLAYQDWNEAIFILPGMVVLYGFHNLVPSLTTYLDHDANRLRLTIILGSIIPLFIYLLWEGLILGLVPLDGENGFRQALSQGDMATRVLRQVIGKAWVVRVAEYFAFFAIITSFLSVALSFVDFLADGLHIQKKKFGKAFLCFLALAFPFFCAMIYPHIFLVALQYAGFAAVILFGLLPVGMVWVGRYRMRLEGEVLVPGGKITLGLVTLFSLAVMVLLIYQKISG